MAQYRFPDARNLGLFTASLLNGGGRHTDTEISAADLTAVITWFEEQLGPMTKRFDDEVVVWQWKSPGRVVEEVWVKRFDADRPGAARDLSAEELSTYQTTIVYEYHVLPPPWWQFWRRR